MLSNGQLMVGLNEAGLVHDFYYPYVGLENLTTARSVHHKIGVWVDGTFSWVDDKTWDVKVDFETDALISNVELANNALGIKIRTKDFVDANTNAFIRRVNVSNLTPEPRDVRLFMHQVFEISRAGRADTAFYEPDGNYIFDYKGRCALLICGQTKEGKSLDQYAVGNYGIESKAGTFMDAVDGSLSGNAVEHGGVDSVIRFSIPLESHASADVDYWIIASSSQYEAQVTHSEFLEQGIDKREALTRDAWAKWMASGNEALAKLPEEFVPAVKKSLLVIKSHIDTRGGILASGDSSIFNYGRDYYCYVWPRDGAYAVWPLIRMGFKKEAVKFFEFCRDTMHKDGYLLHKYQPDRAIGSTWHPLVHNNRSELAIQEDETAIVLAMLGEYYDYTKDREFTESLYATFIEPAANFISKFIDEETNLPHASYDLWEEKFLTSTYTTATVIRGLRRASSFAELFGFPDDAMRWAQVADSVEASLALLFDPEKQSFRKGLIVQPDGNLEFDNTVDASSLYGILMFTSTKLDNTALQQTVAAIEKLLVNQTVGGVIRYENDNYMKLDSSAPSNPWFVCTMWLAQYYVQQNQVDKAKDLVRWSMSHSLGSGVLSEQVNPNTGYAIGVAPLVWSHAEIINTVLDISGAN
jgi:GH15 family glucan-1,4-alpha-glucosidase